MVERHEFEPIRFDFKAVLNAERGDREQHREGLAKAASSMANSGGGYLLFGITDRNTAAGPSAQRIVGIPRTDLLKEFVQKLHDVQPPVPFEATPSGLPLPSDGRRCVFVVRIEDSSLRPHMFRGGFYKRGPGGSAEFMDWMELRDQMLLREEGLRKAALLQLELELRTVEQTADWLRGTPNLSQTMVRLDTSIIRRLIAEIVTILPRERSTVQNLLDITRYSGVVNRHLDFATAPSSGASYTGLNEPAKQEVKRLLQQIHELASLCGQTLAGFFGAV